MKLKIVYKNYALFYILNMFSKIQKNYKFMIYFMNFKFYRKEAIIDYIDYIDL